MNARRKGTSSPPDPQVREFIDHAHRTYLEKYGRKLTDIPSGARAVKGLLKAWDDLELLKRCWDFFLRYQGDDWQIKDATRDLKNFGRLAERIFQKHPQLKGKVPENSRRHEIVKAPDVPPAETEPDMKPSGMSDEGWEKKIRGQEAKLKWKYPASRSWGPELIRQTAIANLKNERG